MIEIEKVLNQAIKKDASDIHFICGIKPMLRIIRQLVEAEQTDTPDMTYPGHGKMPEHIRATRRHE